MNNRPSDGDSKRIKRCFSLESSFDCVSNRVISGYYIKAITYKNKEVISENNWEVVE